MVQTFLEAVQRERPSTHTAIMSGCKVSIDADSIVIACPNPTVEWLLRRRPDAETMDRIGRNFGLNVRITTDPTNP